MRSLLATLIRVPSVVRAIIYKLIISESTDKLLILFSRSSQILRRNIIPRYLEAIEIYINEL